MPFLMQANVGHITGVITDSAQTPIEGVYVFAANTAIHDSSDAQGRFTLDGFDNGYYDIYFTHPGYNGIYNQDNYIAIYDTVTMDVTMTAWAGCDYVVGDANNSGMFNGLDITFGVAYFKNGPPPPYACECPGHGIWFVAGDVNASCSYNGLDITYGVNYLKGQAPEPFPCAYCLPVGE